MNRWVKVLVVLVVIALVGMTSLGAGVLIGSSGVGSALWRGGSGEEPEQFGVFWQAWDIVQKNFVDRDALDPTAMTYGAIRGMVTALGDEGHTAFLTPEERERQQSDLSGTFSGIGAQLGVRDQLPVIVAPFDGSPADQAGVKAGDIIIKVDGQDVTTLPLNEIVALIRGPEGTDVTLSLLRPDENRSLEVTITRGEIKVPAASWAMIPGTQVALIRLSQFSANALPDVVRSVSEAKESGAASLIVDVRNNPGGLLEQAISVTSQFLKDGNVLLEEDAQGQRKAYAVESGGVATDLPLVVLINPGSASSAEIFAGAIQDHERGKLVGETTFGTGTVLQPYILEDGSALLLGTRQWLTPNGRLIRKQGISPDVAVELPIEADLLTPEEIEGMTPEELSASADTQMLKALELLGARPPAE
ncbi:MAG: S41 family peptidase [Caldilineaceae bacterium]|nr:S41 family peptidase [Caldilineaceae bacterium]